MNRAPAVSIRVRASLVQGAVIFALGTTALSVYVPLAHSGSAREPFLSLAALFMAGVLTWAFLRWRQTPAGLLSWDGQGWAWELGGKHLDCQVKLCIDFQSVVVVRVRVFDAGRHWLWLQRGSSRQWHALRCALVASQNQAKRVAGADSLANHEVFGAKDGRTRIESP